MLPDPILMSSRKKNILPASEKLVAWIDRGTLGKCESVFPGMFYNYPDLLPYVSVRLDAKHTVRGRSNNFLTTWGRKRGGGSWGDIGDVGKKKIRIVGIQLLWIYVSKFQLSIKRNEFLNSTY